jgi:hypothetical protein
LLGRPALDFEQLDRFGMGGQMRLGIEDTRDLFCVLHPIGTEFVHAPRGLRRDLGQRSADPDRCCQHQPINALGVVDSERLCDQTAEGGAVDVRLPDTEP